jgi:MFS family permease
VVTSHKNLHVSVASPAPSVRPRIFFGWKVASASSLILTLQSALVTQAFGSYAVVLQEKFGWSKTTISLAYSFNRAESGLLGPIHGTLLTRYGSKAVMRAGSLITLIGFIWFSQISTPLGFILSFFVIAIGSGLAGFLTVTTETVQWFERKRSKALSLASFGFALGGFLAPVLVYSLRMLGWRWTAVISGVILFFLGWGLSQLFGTSPAQRSEPIDGMYTPMGDPEPARIIDNHFTAREALRTRAFWMISFGHASALLVVGTVIAHLSLFLTLEQGFTLQSASFVVAGIPIAQILGMVLGGFFGDRFNKRYLCAGAMMGHVIGLLALTFATNALMIWGFVLLHGMAWGMRGPLMSAIRADYFGPSSFGQILGYSSVILMFGMIGGPLLAGILADVTGDYRLGFSILSVLAVFGSAFFMLATPPTR